MREKPVLVQKETSLVGILTESPSEARAGRVSAVVVLNGGLIHRVGPNRIYVKIARDLALLGYPVLRFDFSGMGDSASRGDDIPFAVSSVRETRQMMDYLMQTRRAERFVLLGMCSGADAALRTACVDDRVIGLVGINGAFLGEHDTRKLQESVKDRVLGRYYRRAVLDPKKWLRVLRGQSDIKSFARRVIRRWRQSLAGRPDEPSPEGPPGPWQTLMERGVDLLFVYSEGSSTLDAFSMAVEPHLRSVGAAGRVQVELIERADHVFTPLWSQERLREVIRSWFLTRTERSSSKQSYWVKPATPAAQAGRGCENAW